MLKKMMLCSALFLMVALAISGCIGEDTTDNSFDSHETSVDDSTIQDPDTGYDEPYVDDSTVQDPDTDYDEQERIREMKERNREIQDESQERIRELQEEQRQREEDRLVNDLSYDL